MAANVTELNDTTFDQAVAQGVALVDFWAPWCGPCQTQGPIVEELAGEVGDDVTVAKLNVDDHQTVAGRFNVMSIPTIVVFRNGQEVARFIGVQDKETLLDSLSKA